jgi:hypothetical protein
VASFAECAGEQCSGLRRLVFAMDIIQERLGSFLTTNMTLRNADSLRRVSRGVSCTVVKLSSGVNPTLLVR